MKDQQKKSKRALPVLFLESADLQILPSWTRQLDISTAAGSKALAQTVQTDGQLLLVAHRAPDKKDKGEIDRTGCLVRLVQDVKLSSGTHKVLITGVERCLVQGLPAKTFAELDKEQVTASYLTLKDVDVASLSGKQAIRRSIMRLINRLGKGSTIEIGPEALRNARAIKDLSSYIDFWVLSLATGEDADFCQQILEELDVESRAVLLVSFLNRKLEENKIDRRIRRRVKQQMEKTHQEFHLAEQAKAIQEELDSEGSSDIENLRRTMQETKMPEAARKKCETELARLEAIAPASPESSVLRTYIDTLLGLPWETRSELNTDMLQAQKTLDGDHHGLKKIKDRILEYLAVQRRIGKPRGSVLCFVGPPGVGKTSLGQSIARATGREFIRVSLGGVHEEAAIRGHRKTYVASMPGRILKAMAKAKVRNPVFMLDEFDKVVSGSGFYGDPSSALLEVLDPEQNFRFIDQYVEVEFDLSEVMFITTANSVRYLPDALYDRLEIIELPGYLDNEKMEIAKRHLIPKQLEGHGLANRDINFSDTALNVIVRDYTNEAGVRELERNIARICRKIATERVLAKEKGAKAGGRQFKVTKANVAELLEHPDYYSTFNMPARDRIGYVNGLIYGRGVHPLEAVVFKTSGSSSSERAEITGITKGVEQLNALHDVTMSILKSRRKSLGLAEDFSKNRRVHIHLQDRAGTPYGAVGVSVFVLLASAYTGTPVKAGTALVGEINLRGDVISSEHFSEYKAAVLDAQRKKIRRIVMPAEDVHMLAELPAELTDNIEFIPVRNVEEALKHSLVRLPKSAGVKEQVPLKRKKAAVVRAH